MNVIKLSQDAALGLHVRAAEAEGFRFVKRARLELNKGDFDKPETVLFGATADNLIGIGGVTPDPYPDAEPNSGRLRHLYMLPWHRHRGVGRKLLRALVKEAGQYYPVLRLRTTAPDAARFYETLGVTAVTEPRATRLAFG